MGLGIREPAGLENSFVPGTSLLFDLNHEIAANPKHASGKEADLILVPQPSSSPRDPLNWPLWKKDLTYFAICFNVLLGAVLSPVLTTCGSQIVKEFNITFNQYALLSGWALLASACSSWLAQVSARIWGKRPTYMLATALLLATTIWTSRVTSYRSFVAARALEGVGNGPFESIVLSSVGDMYFVHQRGKRILFYNMMTLSTVSLSPIVGGYITEKYGWRTQFYIIAGFLLVGLVLLFFACPEHEYTKPAVCDTCLAVVKSTEKVEECRSTPAGSSSSIDTSQSYAQQLRPYGKRLTEERITVLLTRPLVCMVYPAVLWAFFLGGCWSTWNAAVVIILSQIFSTPPNQFSPSQLGYIYTFPFVASIIAYILGSLAADSMAKAGARRNKGLFEPEYRQWLLIPAFFVGIPGVFAFGHYATQRDDSWVLISFIYSLIVCATVFSSAGAYAYILDSHRDLSVEVSVAYVVLRNLLWFGASWFMPSWLEVSGAAKTFYTIGGIQTGISIIAVLGYRYGKVGRYWINRHDPLRALHLL